MTTIETVKVKKDSQKGYHIINKSDFIEGVHDLYDPASEQVDGTEEEMSDDPAEGEQVDAQGLEPVKRGRKAKAE